MKTSSKLLAFLFFSFVLASTTGCSIVEKYTSPESNIVTGAKKPDKKTDKKAGKIPKKKISKKTEEEENGITVYDIGGYAIKATLVYALIIALSN